MVGMSSTACPLPLNGSLALTPGTSVQFKPDPLLSITSSEQLTITAPSGTSGAQFGKPLNLAKSLVVPFPKAGTYKLRWEQTTLGILGTTQVGKLEISSSAQKCVVAAGLPTPSLSVPVVPPSVTGPINGVVSGVVGGVNQGIAPINGILGPVVGGVTGGKPTTAPAPGSTSTAPGSILGYKPTALTPADKTVPKGGTGGGTGGTYVAPGLDGPINAPALGFNGSNAKATAANSTAKPKPAPSSVDLASSTDRSAISGLPSLLVVFAVIALSAGTALYARTFLWRRPQAAKPGA
jgi:hypothetical protein